jgi:hypothetical protein
MMQPLPVTLPPIAGELLSSWGQNKSSSKSCGAFIIQKHNNIDIADLLVDSVGTSGGPNGGRCFGAFVADHDGF